MNSSGQSNVVFIDDQGNRKVTESQTNARILVVEDEGIVLETLTIIFSNAGYDVRSAKSAEAALALLQTEAWAPQLAIIDVILPGMNGIELAISLKARYSNMRVSLYSGLAATADLLAEARGQGHSFDDVLPKPIHPTVLLDIASRLQSGGGRPDSTQA